MEEQAQRKQAEPFEGMPAAEQRHDQEQHLKTIAVRVEEGLHAQLRFIAQLNDSSISEEIRRSIESRIASAQDDPELVARAQEAHDEIEREAAARSAAIAGFLAKPAITATTEQAEPAPRGRRTSKATNE